MEILKNADEIHITFGQVPLQIFSQPTMVRLEPDEYSLEMLIDELRRRGYKLVEAQQYRATPAITGTVSFRFRPPEEDEQDTCSCTEDVVFKMLRGNMGESWKIRMGTIPAVGEGTPTRTILRIHLMPISEDGMSAREQDRSCEPLAAQMP